MKSIKYLTSTILFFFMMSFTSCLEAGLDELPAYGEADITDFYFEYRYQVERSDGVKEIKYMRMINDKKEIGEDGTIRLEVSIPQADETFTEVERAKVSLDRIVGYCYLSNSAEIEPIDGAPELGTIGNFSSSVKYKVTAADKKNVKVWTITTVLNK